MISTIALAVSLALSALLKGFGLIAVIGGGLLAGSLVLVALLALVAALLAFGLLAGTAGLVLPAIVVLVVVGAVLLPVALPVLLVYLLLRPRRPVAASRY